MKNFLQLSKDIKLEFHNDKLCGVVVNYDDKPALFQREAYFLTTSGKKHHAEFYVGAFSLLNEDTTIDLLEEDSLL